ncbi:MAG: C25 family cysteine peptidase [Lysobacterales bacterium]
MYTSQNDNIAPDVAQALDDLDLDPLSVAGDTVHFPRLATQSNLTRSPTFSSVGTWTLRVCDSTNNGVTGSLLRSRLVLRNNAGTAGAVCGNRLTYNWGDNGNNVDFVTASIGGVTISDGGNSGNPPGDSRTSYQTCNTGTNTTAPCRAQSGGDTGYFNLSMDASGGDSEATAERSTFNFSTPVLGLQFAMGDLDRRTSGNDYEDSTRVQGFGPSPGNARQRYQMTITNNAQLRVFGDWAEANRTEAQCCADSDNNGNVTFEFDRPVSQLVVQYGQSNEPATDPDIQYTSVNDLSFCAFDWGDGPSSYGTLDANNGPRHGLGLRETLFIGSGMPDGETDALTSSGATGDDTLLADEGSASITFPPARVANQGWVCGAYTTNPATNEYCVTVQVTNTSGSTAQLVGWIDFNNNGTFDAGERSLPDLASTSGSFATGNIPDGSNNISAVLVFLPSVDPIPNNTNPSMVRLRLTTDTSTGFFSDPSHLGLAANGEVEDIAIPINTLPVTLAGFSSVRLADGSLLVRWSVATEAGTFGYRVLQGDAAGASLDSQAPITPAHAVDSLEPQHYEFALSSRSDAPLYLEELSAAGLSERFGPFAVGKSWGETLSFSAPPWGLARNERATAARLEAAARLGRQQILGQASAEILVDATGLQRVAVADLIAAGIDFGPVFASAVQLRRGQQTVPFRIDGDGRFVAGNFVEFYGEAVSGSQYTTTRPYVLQAGNGLVWDQEDAAPTAPQVTDAWSKQFVLDADRYYSFSAPTDPWYHDTVQRNGASGGKSFTLDLSGLRGGSATLILDLWGGVDFATPGDDHRYQLSLNGEVLGERSFDGVNAHRSSWEIDESLLVEGANTVRIDLLPTANTIDILRVESVSIIALAELRAADTQTARKPGDLRPHYDGISHLSFEDSDPAVECGPACSQVAVVGLPNPDVLALRLSDRGGALLQGVAVEAVDGAWRARLRVPSFFGGGDGVSVEGGQLIVVSRSQAHLPAVRPAANHVHPLQGGPAQLLALAPFRFLADVEPLLQARRSEGLSARAVDLAQIYAHYSEGIIDPLAIKRFLAEARTALGTDYVLLVGGDTYDYFDRLGLGSVSDLPTLYGPTHPVVRHAPLDDLYADVDNDGRSDLAVGRFPVRTSAELQSVVDKSLSFGQANMGPLGLFVAERSNPAEGVDFDSELDQVVSTLSADWQVNASRVYLDEYAVGSPGTSAARADLIAGINQGVALVSYFGHGSPTIWSREQLLQATQIPSLLSNAVAPVVSELGCWGGFFVAPQYNTMAHGWLNVGGKGASALFASGGLTEHHSDRRMAETLLPLLTNPGVRIGDALRQAKQVLHAGEPELSDVLRGLTLFGDPTLRMPQLLQISTQ